VPTHQTSMLLGMRDTAAMSPSTVTEAGLNEAAGDLDYGDRRFLALPIRAMAGLRKSWSLPTGVRVGAKRRLTRRY
jgi:hypothetical protein